VDQGDELEQHETLLRRGTRLLVLSARTHPRTFVISVLGSTLYATMAVAGTVVLGKVTDKVLVPAFKGGVTWRTVLIGGAAIIGVSVLRAFGVVLRRYFGQLTSRGMQKTWFTRVTDRYLEVPLSYFQAHPTGELLAHADADVERATMALQPLPFSLGVIVLIAGATISLALVDPLLMLIGVALFPSLALMNRVYTRRVEQPAARAQARVGDVSAVAHESFEGALVVKTLGLEQIEVARLSVAAEALRQERLLVGRLRAGFEPGLDALPSLGTIALLAVGSWRLSTGAVTAGGLVQAMSLFGILAFPMRIVGFLLEELPRAVVAHDRIKTVLAASPKPLPAAEHARPLPAGPLDVAVEGVAFAYGNDAVLGALDFTLEAGEIVALVGATGTGKSTICQLLTHLIDPAAGTIRVGGVDVSHVESEDLRRSVALVFQETFLFGDSVRENLTLGEDFEDSELDAALDVAKARRFVGHMPGGLDAVIGERGVTLSGGQRQRLALARALLRRPRVLLLDDATSAVDATVERQVLDGLRGTLEATTLIVAHRVSTIALADRVLFLVDGRIAASGAHADLLAIPEYEALVRAYEAEEIRA
jgi:ATP-binding cassette subfamily B protein